jgi:hypothetical protein
VIYEESVAVTKSNSFSANGKLFNIEDNLILISKLKEETSQNKTE